MMIACHYGYGQPWKSLTPFDRREALKVRSTFFIKELVLDNSNQLLTGMFPQYFYLCQITYKFSINLTKASILLLYIRIFGNIRWFKLVCALILTSVGIYCTASVIATIFQCIPIAKAFDRTLEGHCIDNGRFW